jgi:REP element-mobilizing transposase RayT
MHPLAYHLIWTTYGTWLPGDARGWIESGVLGVQDPDPKREDQARDLMAEAAVRLGPEQRQIVTQTIQDHCRLRSWQLRAVNVRSNHVHVVLTCPCSGEQARDQLKQWASRRLSDHAGLKTGVARKAGRRRWWTEGGDARPIDDESYFANAVEYVINLQGA